MSSFLASSPVPSHHNVPVPFAADIPEGVFPGKAIVVKGVLVTSREHQRFCIDLCCGKLVQGEHQDDKALHVNPRFDQGGSLFSRPDRDIVLNTLINNSWGQEQRCQNQMELGKPFSIRILILRDYFKISLNGKHMCDFIHRIPPESIKCIFISGCVSIDVVEYQGTKPNASSLWPVPNVPSCDLDEPIEFNKLDIPFVFNIPSGGFFPPREIHAILTPLINATNFSLNILKQEEYLFHMRVDFPKNSDEKGVVVRNNTIHGEWQREERQMGRFPFLPGVTSDVKVVAATASLKVIVDGSFFCDFNYRAGVIPTEATQITIRGDLGLQKFIFRNRIAG